MADWDRSMAIASVSFWARGTLVVGQVLVAVTCLRDIPSTFVA
jgi:hypothetical protein